MQNVQKAVVVESKKQYTRPEVAKHGNVETLTQFNKWTAPSGPIHLEPR